MDIYISRLIFGKWRVLQTCESDLIHVTFSLYLFTCVSSYSCCFFASYASIRVIFFNVTAQW